MIPDRYEPNPDLLAGRVILVTGAGQGLGREVAIACARHGATVALLGKRQHKLEATYDAITANQGAEPALVPLDLEAAGSAEFEALAQLIRKDLKRLDGIAHCASHFVPLGPLANQTVETWMTLLKVNLAAPFAITRACLPLLASAPDSSVVFTGETHGLNPAAYWGGFAVSKSGLGPLAHIWADERGRTPLPRMNVLIPGPIASPQRARSHPGEDPGVASQRRGGPRAHSCTCWARKAPPRPAKRWSCEARHRLFGQQSVKLGFGRNLPRKYLHYHN